VTDSPPNLVQFFLAEYVAPWLLRSASQSIPQIIQFGSKETWPVWGCWANAGIDRTAHRLSTTANREGMPGPFVKLGERLDG
jgi:hypothetical protein